MGRFDTAAGEIVPYSDKRPDRCEPQTGAAFVLPGEDVARRCGDDPAMPPASEMPFWKRRVVRAHASLKQRSKR